MMSCSKFSLYIKAKTVLDAASRCNQIKPANHQRKKQTSYTRFTHPQTPKSPPTHAADRPHARRRRRHAMQAFPSQASLRHAAAARCRPPPRRLPSRTPPHTGTPPPTASRLAADRPQAHRRPLRSASLQAAYAQPPTAGRQPHARSPPVLRRRPAPFYHALANMIWDLHCTPPTMCYPWVVFESQRLTKRH
jgi:hypothetical protein